MRALYSESLKKPGRGPASQRQFLLDKWSLQLYDNPEPPPWHITIGTKDPLYKALMPLASTTWHITMGMLLWEPDGRKRVYIWYVSFYFLFVEFTDNSFIIILNVFKYEVRKLHSMRTRWMKLCDWDVSYTSWRCTIGQVLTPLHLLSWQCVCYYCPIAWTIRNLHICHLTLSVRSNTLQLLTLFLLYPITSFPGHL